MKKLFDIAFSCLILLFVAACTDEHEDVLSLQHGDARELTGIRAVIASNVKGDFSTRAGAVTPLADYVGRMRFKGGDRAVFTEIRRTTAPIINFTYPDGTYAGIIFEAGSEGGWSRANDGGPDRVYWTDATSAHTFVAYSKPQDSDFEWYTYEFTQGDTKKTYYLGSLGNPAQTGEGKDTIDYTLEVQTQETIDGVKYYMNPKLEAQDLLIAHDNNMQAETGGSVALVKFYHALSSIRVVVNISGFSSTASDHAAVVTNMKLLHQPTMYVWQQSDWGAQPLRASRSGQSFTDQAMVNKAYTGSESGSGPAFDQRKDLKLWIPIPAGSGTEQSKTFTFYGITTPQPSDYISTLPTKDDDGYDAAHPYRYTELLFNVTYPNPMKPSTNVTKPYKATLPDVYFEAGYNTTINISLNHENEEMTVGVEYENWQYAATPDQGELRKNSTFLQDTERTSITIVGDPKATEDDATWLYEATPASGDTPAVIKDIYGHEGDSEDDAYQISTAYQLLSLAYEVAAGNDFDGKFIRLDADITMQSSSVKTREETVKTSDDQSLSDIAYALSWIGIGDADNAFNGTFLGGNRYIYRLKGKPLFANLSPHAKIEQLQLEALTLGNSDYAYTVVDGGGLLAETNEGVICACRVVNGVTLNGDVAGAFVGHNAGTIYASYHVGATKGTAEDAIVGGLAGSNSGTIANCYHAGTVTGTVTGGITADNGEDTESEGTLTNNYYNSTLLPSPTFTATGATDKPETDMMKHDFVESLNAGIDAWEATHASWDQHIYEYQPANYPKLKNKTVADDEEEEETGGD